MRSTKRYRLAAVCALGLALVCGARAADAGDAVVLVGGPAPAKSRDVVAASAAKQTAERWTVVDTPAELDVGAIIECLATEGSPDCSHALLERATVDRVLVLNVRTEGDRRSTNLVITGWILAHTGDLLVSDGRECEQCRAEVLTSATGELVDGLWQEALARSGPTRLAIRTQPDGAEIEIDGRRVGVTDFEYGVSPGLHKITLRKEGFRPEVREVVARERETVSIDVELREDGGTGKPPRTGRVRRSRTIPWIVTGSGAALLVAGGVLVGLDEDAPGGGDDERVLDFPDTLVSGLVIGGVGAAAVGVGVYLLLTSSRDAPSVTVTPERHGWSVSWNRRF